MRPVSAEFPVNQPFGSMKTAGVAPSWTPDTVGWYVRLYGNYQPYGHAGCDIKCPEGTPVYAMAAGTVLWADWGTKLPGDETNAGYRQRWYLYKGFPGIVTVIQHDGWIGVYAHLSRASMNTGDKVREGQQIGLSGGTGGVAPHLHVEALVDLSFKTGGGLIYGRTNPEQYFGSAAIAPQAEAIKPIPKEWDDMATPQELFNAIWGGPGMPMLYNNELGRKEYPGTMLGAMTDRVVRQQITPLRREIAAQNAQVVNLITALAKVAGGEPFDQDKLLAGVKAAAEAGIKAGIQDGTVTVDINVAGGK
ncbi:M23 family metallopeptidase [Arthrobacter sp. Soil763]|uniref:M23 family metallopeptidase n=1 Tax=Arthrobacter sp. Soil763 TaxID=1736402 RepID=UPI0006F750BF|nr:M23 family metallopeptidase [Arthrobacter sp. Soil763]KRE79936.1 hypothetical protein ASG71_07840 [Arthrobacter sp. Soil763]